MKNKANNNHWFLIIAKDNSCQGYIPAKDKEEACEKFGLEPEECSIKKVIRMDKGFIEPDQSEQRRLL